MRLIMYAGQLWFDDKPIARVEHLDPSTISRLHEHLEYVDALDPEGDEPLNIDLTEIDRYQVVLDGGTGRITGTYFEGPCLPDDHRVATVVELSDVKLALKAESVAFKDDNES